MKKFDLNTEKVLEHWEVSHALREVIANALDEQILTETKDIKIFKSKVGSWHIRDYGRGIKYQHLTQNENQEKLRNASIVIGKFGVGLKDSLATFDRRKVGIKIKSRFGEITLGKSSKHGFEDIKTLHALISEPIDKNFIGTEFLFNDIKDNDIKLAKDYFLKFSDEKLLEQTQYGQVLKKGKGTARIYINGLRVAEEENFLFSYNITSLTQSMRKALNRERTNVGRSAYTDRIKAILLECKSKNVAELLVSDLKEFETGKSHDELNWIDVAVHACRLLNATENVIFVTSFELIEAKSLIDSAINDGYKVVTIPLSIREKIKGLRDINRKLIRDLSQYTFEFNSSFEYKFISEKDLTSSELAVFKKKDLIFKLIGGKPKQVKEIKISAKMRLEGFNEAVGVFEPLTMRVIIKRNQLKNISAFAGTLLHETAHAKSGASDVSREFEMELTNLLGLIAAHNT